MELKNYKYYKNTFLTRKFSYLIFYFLQYSSLYQQKKLYGKSSIQPSIHEQFFNEKNCLKKVMKLENKQKKRLNKGLHLILVYSAEHVQKYASQ